jgi:hypothetical protein
MFFCQDPPPVAAEITAEKAYGNRIKIEQQSCC